MTSNHPTDHPQAQGPGRGDAGSEQKWAAPGMWALGVTVLVGVPVVALLTHAAEDADVPHWATAAVSAVIALAAFALFAKGTGGVTYGVLFGLWITFLLNAIDETALALDVSEMLITWALAGPILVVMLWRYARTGGW